jgi:hypothetical protein
LTPTDPLFFIKGLTTDSDVTNNAFVNISVSSFTTDFSLTRHHLCQPIGEVLRHHQLRLHQHIGEGFTIDFGNNQQQRFCQYFDKELRHHINVIDYTFANSSARGFANDFSVINNAFINISTRGFIINFNFINKVFTNVSTRGFDSNFDIIGYASSTFHQGALPSTMA